MSSRYKKGGCERIVEDAPIIGDSSLIITTEHNKAILETEAYKKKVRTLREHRNRIKHVHEFLEKSYKDYFTIGTREITEEELRDPSKYWHKNKRDLVCKGINIKVLKAFLSTKAKKENGKTSSYSTIRKYFDAILCGSKEAKEPLPPSFYTEMEIYLMSFKKRVANAKESGDIDEKEADPIPFSLCNYLCKWSIEEDNVFSWAWTVTQWNCISRPINVEPISLFSLRPYEDCVKVKFESTKSDQAGEKCLPKHVCANIFDPEICFFTAMGVFLCLHASSFENNANMFQCTSNEKTRNASKKYCSQVSEIFRRNSEIVHKHVRPNHDAVYGIRKGSASHATTGTTCPPPIPSVAHRGEWSMGKVLDVYWHFSEPGDTCLGRILAGYDPNSNTFGSLPPHFTIDNPAEDEHVNEAMNQMHGPILARFKDSTSNPYGILLLFLASVVYHENWIKGYISRNSNHSFLKIPMLHNSNLMSQLRSKVSTEPSNVIKRATGIPPHVQAAVTMHKLIAITTDTLEEVRNLTLNMRAVISDAIDAKSLENGQVSAHEVKNILNDFKGKVLGEVQSLIKEMRSMHRNDDVESSAISIRANSANKHAPFLYADLNSNIQRMYQVPKCFKFPQADRKQGWQFWLLGIQSYPITKNNTTIYHAILPFQKFNLSQLPSGVKDAFKINWKPIYSIMEDGINIDQYRSLSISEFIDTTYDLGTKNIKKRASYIWGRSKNKCDVWKVSTWSKHVQYSMIAKYGAEDDRRNLPAKKRHNKDKGVTKRKRSLKEITRTPRKVKKKSVSANNENSIETHAEINLSDTSSISENEDDDECEIAVKNRSIFQKTTQKNKTFTRETHSEEASARTTNERNSIVKEKSLIILKRNGSGALESKPCFYCKKLPSNHYCLAEVRDSNVVAEGEESKHICGRNSCILCRSNWGEPEDFASVCVDHK